MSPFAKYALCSLLGLAIGVAGTVLIVATAVIPKFNKALDEDQKTIAAKDQIIASQLSVIESLQGQLSMSRVKPSKSTANSWPAWHQRFLNSGGTITIAASPKISKPMFCWSQALQLVAPGG